MPNQCYFDGNFYQCLTATAAQSPAESPNKWAVVNLPSRWRWVLARLTYANLLELDGQKDKANAERALAINDERRGLDWMIRTEANLEAARERPSARLRT